MTSQIQPVHVRLAQITARSPHFAFFSDHLVASFYATICSAAHVRFATSYLRMSSKKAKQGPYPIVVWSANNKRLIWMIFTVLKKTIPYGEEFGLGKEIL